MEIFWPASNYVTVKNASLAQRQSFSGLVAQTLETGICFLTADEFFFSFASLVTCGVATPGHTWSDGSEWPMCLDLGGWGMAAMFVVVHLAELWRCWAVKNWVQLGHGGSLVHLLTSGTWHWTRVPQNTSTLTCMRHKCLNVATSALSGATFRQ